MPLSRGTRWTSPQNRMASHSTTMTAHRASPNAATRAPLWIRWTNSMLATIAPGRGRARPGLPGHASSGISAPAPHSSGRRRMRQGIMHALISCRWRFTH